MVKASWGEGGGGRETGRRQCSGLCSRQPMQGPQGGSPCFYGLTEVRSPYDLCIGGTFNPAC